MILSSGIAPVVAMRNAGCPVGLGCDGSSSADAGSLWQEARLAMLQGKLVSGASQMDARIALEIATRGGAACLGRVGEIGELSVGAVGDIAIWRLDGPQFAGVLDDPLEGWLRCGPFAATHVFVHGKQIVNEGIFMNEDLEDVLTRHQIAAERFQP